MLLENHSLNDSDAREAAIFLKDDKILSALSLMGNSIGGAFKLTIFSSSLHWHSQYIIPLIVICDAIYDRYWNGGDC